jgi:2-polyprenyl-3-methyl-5-hydroxy-6-metoxy-1,4-benzoquinol methylase
MLPALEQVVADYNKTQLAVEFPFLPAELPYHRLLVDLGLKYLPEEGRPAVLDIGTGRGICPRFFASRGIRTISLDFPATAGNTALECAAEAGVETHECDCSQDRFPLESESVNCVYLGDVIEHLPHSPKWMLSEIYRVLRRGGVCITSTPNAVRLTVRLKMLLGSSNWPRVNDYYDSLFHGGHHHEYTAAELLYVHERAGFRIVEMRMMELNALQAPIENLSDLQSGARDGAARRKALRFGMARRLLYAVSLAVPRLRGQMILVAQK